MIFAETIQFTPEQERAIFVAFFVFLAACALFVIGFVLSIVAGLRCGRDPRRKAARVYWLLWVAGESVAAVGAVGSMEPFWIGVVGTMLGLTVGSERFGRYFLRRDEVTRATTPPEASRPAHQNPAGPGSRP